MKPFGDKPPADHEDIRNTRWDAKAEKFWVYQEGKEEFPPFFKTFLLKYQSTLGKKVLDIGLGTGQYAVPLAKRNFEVTGVEPSLGMRRGAERNFKLADVEGKIRLLNEQSKNLSCFSDANFDWIISIGAIHHNPWPDIEKSFAEAARVLKPGQLFVFHTRSVNDSKKIRERIFNDNYGGYTALDSQGWKTKMVQHYFSEKGLRELGAKNGFQIVEGPKEELGIDKGARWWVVYRKI